MTAPLERSGKIARGKQNKTKQNKQTNKKNTSEVSYWGAGEMVQWLRALVTLSEGLGPAPT